NLSGLHSGVPGGHTHEEQASRVLLFKQFVAIATPACCALSRLVFWEKLLQNHGEKKFSQDVAFEFFPGCTEGVLRDVECDFARQHRWLSKILLWVHNLCC